MLKLNQVTKRYSKMLAADQVSFQVDGGSATILLGPNGAGKSTIIKCICGLLKFDGSVTINEMGNRTLQAKRMLGYVPELPAMYSLLTVSEHMEFIARAYSLEDGWQDRRDQLLARFELADKTQKLGRELSKGMQQKVSICCALLPEPKAVVLDEPLVGLDPHAIKELRQVIQELKSQDCAILISTHMIDSVEDYWDVAHIMMHGKIRATVRNDESENLEKRFFEITEGDAQ